MQGGGDCRSTAPKSSNPRRKAHSTYHLVEEQENVQKILGEDKMIYRRSAQAILVNEDGKILVFTPVGKSNGAFLQCPQGGIERHETPIQAAMRETLEETGIDLSKHGKLIGPVLPLDMPSNCELIDNMLCYNKKTKKEDHVALDETRRAFRYNSKTWTKYNIKGQELYPVMFSVDSNCAKFVDCASHAHKMRQELKKPHWCNFDDLPKATPKSKLCAITQICEAAKTTYEKYKQDMRDKYENIIAELQTLPLAE